MFRINVAENLEPSKVKIFVSKFSVTCLCFLLAVTKQAIVTDYIWYSRCRVCCWRVPDPKLQYKRNFVLSFVKSVCHGISCQICLPCYILSDLFAMLYLVVVQSALPADRLTWRSIRFLSAPVFELMCLWHAEKMPRSTVNSSTTTITGQCFAERSNGNKWRNIWQVCYWIILSTEPESTCAKTHMKQFKQATFFLNKENKNITRTSFIIPKPNNITHHKNTTHHINTKQHRASREHHS